MGLEYRGKRNFEIEVPLVRRDTEIETRGGLTATEINNHLDSYLEVYADSQYVDTRDAEKATLSDLDSAGLQLAESSTIGRPGGPVPLNSVGRIPAQYLSGVPLVGARGPWSPTTPNTSRLEVRYETGPTRIQSLTIPDPGFKWRPLMFGQQAYASTGQLFWYVRMTIREYQMSGETEVLGPIVASGRSVGNGFLGLGRVSQSGPILPRDTSSGFTGSKTFGLYAEAYGKNTSGNQVTLDPNTSYWFAYIIPTN